jgi:hypothetical protein
MAIWRRYVADGHLSMTVEEYASKRLRKIISNIDVWFIVLRLPSSFAFLGEPPLSQPPHQHRSPVSSSPQLAAMVASSSEFFLNDTPILPRAGDNQRFWFTDTVVVFVIFDRERLDG